MNAKYEKYKEHLGKLADVKHSVAVLNWDQETYMPAGSASLRAQQISTLSGIAHEMAVSDEYGALLDQLLMDDNLDNRQKVNIQQSFEAYTKQKKFSTKFVQKLSGQISKSFQAWQEAKGKSDFTIFSPELEELVLLKKEEAEIIGFEKCAYDAMLDEFEPGLTIGALDKLFSGVREQLVGFVKSIREKKQIDDSFMYKHYDNDTQWEFGIQLLKQMGYDFNTGRQDRSAHPFTTSFGSQDVRVTTRVSANDLNEMIWSCIHEGGHALYEQGLRKEDYGLPTGNPISLGIHESQSRLWENNVGRSFNYWNYNFANLQQQFPNQLYNVTAEGFYKAMNIVKPSLIRTSADELNYHFHVMIRYEIEKSIFENSIDVKHLPEIWNAKYKEYLGVDVPNDAEGVLQDIHWSHGCFGYFPTYSIGSFYAVQFYNKAKEEIADLDKKIAAGDMKPLLDWLRLKVHDHGKLYTAEELCVNITGEKLNFDHFMDYAKIKYSYLYNL